MILEVGQAVRFRDGDTRAGEIAAVQYIHKDAKGVKARWLSRGLGWINPSRLERWTRPDALAPSGRQYRIILDSGAPGPWADSHLDARAELRRSIRNGESGHFVLQGHPERYDLSGPLDM